MHRHLMVEHPGPERRTLLHRRNIVSYFYDERSTLLDNICREYYDLNISGKEYSQRCQELGARTLEKIEEAEHMAMANKIAGKKKSMTTLLGKTVYISS